MTEVDINPEAFASVGLGFIRNGDLAILKKAPDVTARVLVKNDKLQFFPERSSSHKTILAALE